MLTFSKDPFLLPDFVDSSDRFGSRFEKFGFACLALALTGSSNPMKPENESFRDIDAGRAFFLVVLSLLLLSQPVPKLWLCLRCGFERPWLGVAVCCVAVDDVLFDDDEDNDDEFDMIDLGPILVCNPVHERTAEWTDENESFL